jgi:NitT/TauT family transport system permease protein
LFLGIHAAPPVWLKWLLAVLPFILLTLVYQHFSNERLEENDQDKVLPSISQMASAVERMAFHEDKRTGDYVMLQDTVSSLRRLAIGAIGAAIVGFLIGLHLGLFPGFGFLLDPFTTFLSIVPPLALLPILFISFGVDELAKIMLIFIGLFPTLARDITSAVRAIPTEQISKSLTLGANQWQLMWRIVAPQVFPRLLTSLRISLGAAWLFLIAAEAIASTDGLGYRIFLVRRYLAMDVIIPYVLWITALGFSIDWIFKKSIERFFPWYRA